MKQDVIISINNCNEIDKVTDNTKYVNLSICDVNSDIVSYFFNNGQNYSYSDRIDNRNGYIYVSYDIFKEGEEKIERILSKIPNDFSTLEKVRYIYVCLGKLVSFDINVMDGKNDTISLDNFSIINNIWGAIVRGKATSISICKLFMYMCSRVGIKCELVSSSISGNIANKVYLDDTFIIVDIASDIYNIQGGFETLYFDSLNSNKKLDKKIGYIKDDYYMDYYISKVLKKLDYTRENILEEILSLTSQVLDIKRIGVLELAKIYDGIFKKYCPNYDIKINNFFVCNNFNQREHFILISYNDKMYSFNYNKNSFMEVDYDDLISNLKTNKVGIYDGENFNMKEKEMVL